MFNRMSFSDGSSSQSRTSASSIVLIPATLSSTPRISAGDTIEATLDAETSLSQVFVSIQSSDLVIPSVSQPSLTTTTVIGATRDSSSAETSEGLLGVTLGGVLGGLIGIAVLCGCILNAMRRSRERKRGVERPSAIRKSATSGLELSAIDDLPELADSSRRKFFDQESAHRSSQCVSLQGSASIHGLWSKDFRLELIRKII